MTSKNGNFFGLRAVNRFEKINCTLYHKRGLLLKFEQNELFLIVQGCSFFAKLSIEFVCKKAGIICVALLNYITSIGEVISANCQFCKAAIETFFYWRVPCTKYKTHTEWVVFATSTFFPCVSSVLQNIFRGNACEKKLPGIFCQLEFSSVSASWVCDFHVLYVPFSCDFECPLRTHNAFI